MDNLYQNLRKQLRPIKIYTKKILKYFSKLILFFIPNIILDFTLERKKICKKNSISFSIRDYGENCRFRSSTFTTKEPDTLKWIESFDKDSIFIDIGANLGIYSLYASFFSKKVLSFEPDALNYSLLNLNILDNKLAHKIIAYPLSIHKISEFNTLNIQKYEYGGALSSFSNETDQFQKKFLPTFKQGSYAKSLNDVYNELVASESNNSQDIHCKIDVDGNEKIIMDGAIEILKSKKIKSFLIELDTSRDDYDSTIKIFKDFKYDLISKKSSPMFKEVFVTTQNHIFYAS